MQAFGVAETLLQSRPAGGVSEEFATGNGLMGSNRSRGGEVIL